MALAAAAAVGLSGVCAQERDAVPTWAYPVNPPDFKLLPDDGVPRSVPGSSVRYTVTQTRDRFFAPDWHAQEHPSMPEVVARGRRPDVSACGYCHRAGGTGGPENADLAGLPVAYIVRQMQDYKSGARSTAVTGRAPTTLMLTSAKSATDAEIEAAATYFSSLARSSRIRIEESSTAPQTFVAGWFLAATPGSVSEPLGRRIVEVPEDLGQFEARDSHARFVAYVPKGSIVAGNALVETGAGKTVPCSTCHGVDLRGVDDVPSIVGRSPTYVTRQLFEFKAGVRRGARADQMAATVANLSMDDIIAVAAYLAARNP
jgi:cytochrome c553